MGEEQRRLSGYFRHRRNGLCDDRTTTFLRFNDGDAKPFIIRGIDKAKCAIVKITQLLVGDVADGFIHALSERLTKQTVFFLAELASNHYEGGMSKLRYSNGNVEPLIIHCAVAYKKQIPFVFCIGLGLEITAYTIIYHSNTFFFEPGIELEQVGLGVLRYADDSRAMAKSVLLFCQMYPFSRPLAVEMVGEVMYRSDVADMAVLEHAEIRGMKQRFFAVVHVWYAVALHPTGFQADRVRNVERLTADIILSFIVIKNCAIQIRINERTLQQFLPYDRNTPHSLDTKYDIIKNQFHLL